MLDCLRQNSNQGSLLQANYDLGTMSNKPQARYPLQYRECHVEENANVGIWYLCRMSGDHPQ